MMYSEVETVEGEEWKAEVWQDWAEALKRRGLILEGDIDVHGPHHEARLWGTATVKFAPDMPKAQRMPHAFEVEFATRKGCTEGPDYLRVWDPEDGEGFPLRAPTPTAPVT